MQDDWKHALSRGQRRNFMVKLTSWNMEIINKIILSKITFKSKMKFKKTN